MAISALPTPPSRADAANFAARADEFLGALPDFRNEANALAEEMNEAAEAAGDAAATAIAAPGTSATSTTNVEFGLGTKGFGIETGKALVAGMFVAIAQTGSPTNWMHGVIDTYNSGSGALSVIVTATSPGATGSASAWTISISAPIPLYPASAADIWLGTANNLAPTPAALLASNAPVSISDAAIITLDLQAGINFEVSSALAGDRTVGNPLHMIPGQVFSVRVFETTPRSIAFGSYWDLGEGTARLSGANKATKIIGNVRAANHIEATILRGFRT